MREQIVHMELLYKMLFYFFVLQSRPQLNSQLPISHHMKKKSQGFSFRPKLPGPKCTICCLVFSFFGVIILVAIGILLAEPYQKVEGEDLVEDETAKLRSKTAFYTIIPYGLFVVFCAWRASCLRGRPPPKIEGEEEEEEGGAF